MFATCWQGGSVLSELRSAIDDEATRITRQYVQAAESELQSAIDDEATRGQAAESELLSLIDYEATRAQAARHELQSAVGDLRAAQQAAEVIIDHGWHAAPFFRAHPRGRLSRRPGDEH